MNKKIQLLCVGPMARQLRVPVKWLREEAESGRVPHLKAHNVLLFNPEVIERVLLARASSIQNGEISCTP